MLQIPLMIFNFWLGILSPGHTCVILEFKRDDS